MFSALLHIKNYKLFLINMMLLGMGIAITVPYFVLFATNELGMSTNQFGVLFATLPRTVNLDAFENNHLWVKLVVLKTEH